MRGAGARFGGHYLSNAACRIQASIVACVCRRVKDHQILLHNLPRLKRTCFGQVVLRQVAPPESTPGDSARWPTAAQLTRAGVQSACVCTRVHVIAYAHVITCAHCVHHDVMMIANITEHRDKGTKSKQLRVMKH